ncbi:MAG: type II secretion system F family protein [Dehalococcoidia bacterium]
MQFNYIAYSSERGKVEGRIEALDELEARKEIMAQSLKPLQVKPVRELPSREQLFPSVFKVSTAEKIRFFRQMAVMLGSGGNLMRTLQMLELESRNRVMQRVLSSIRKTLEEGGSLSSALARHPLVFNKLHVDIVEVGEHTGRLTPALEQLADILEKDHEAKQKAIKTMMYPMAIIGLSILTLGVLITVALPPLLKSFERLGADTPFVTRVAMSLVGGFMDNILVILVATLLVVFGFVGLRRIPRARRIMDSALLKAPLIGPLIMAGELSRFSRNTAMLLESGVSASKSFQLGTTGCKNTMVRGCFSAAEESLMSGHSMADALKRGSVLPTLFVELVTIGEESNTLQRTMRDSADAYQKELDQRLSSLLGMLEPMSTIVVGAIVGFIAFSMFVPIYSGLEAIK